MLNTKYKNVTELTEQQRDVVIPLMVERFKESAEEAQCIPSIRNIAINPWCILGGIASAVCSDDEIIFFVLCYFYKINCIK